MFNTSAGVTFHLIKDNQRYIRHNTLQLYLMNQPQQSLSAYPASQTEQNQKPPRGFFFLNFVFDSLSNPFCFIVLLRAERSQISYLNSGAFSNGNR